MHTHKIIREQKIMHTQKIMHAQKIMHTKIIGCLRLIACLKRFISQYSKQICTIWAFLAHCALQRHLCCGGEKMNGLKLRSTCVKS